MDATGYEISICVDCLMWHANGETDDSTLPEKIAAHLGDYEVVGLSDDDGSFSWGQCDSCGSTLGGDRFDATVFYRD